MERGIGGREDKGRGREERGSSKTREEKRSGYGKRRGVVVGLSVLVLKDYTVDPAYAHPSGVVSCPLQQVLA